MRYVYGSKADPNFLKQINIYHFKSILQYRYYLPFQIFYLHTMQIKQTVTAQQIKDAYSSVGYEQISKLQQFFGSSKDSSVPKEFLTVVLQESVDLAKFHQCIRLIKQKKQAQNRINDINRRYLNAKVAMQKCKVNLLQEFQVNLIQVQKEQQKQTRKYSKMVQLLSECCKSQKAYQIEQISKAIFEMSPPEQVKIILYYIKRQQAFQSTNKRGFQQSQVAQTQKQLKMEIEQLKKNFQRKENQIIEFKKQYNQILKVKNDVYQQKERKLTSLIQQQTIKGNELIKTASMKQQQIKKLWKQIQILKNQLEDQKPKYKQLKTDAQLQMNDERKKYKQLKMETQIQILALAEGQKRAKDELKLVNQKMAEIQRQSQKLKRQINGYFYEPFFNHEILYDCADQKQYIYDTLCDRYLRRIKATKLIYHYDPLNKVNFHNYIDKRGNILVLVKLRNGRIIAAYTPHSFEQDCRGDDAMLMVVNSKKNFYLKQGSRAISYDEHYIIFGNSEIRLRSGEDLLFSNFGIANSYFQNNRNTVDALLGEGKDIRELPIEGYEIYQVIFDE